MARHGVGGVGRPRRCVTLQAFSVVDPRGRARSRRFWVFRAWSGLRFSLGSHASLPSIPSVQCLFAPGGRIPEQRKNAPGSSLTAQVIRRTSVTIMARSRHSVVIAHWQERVNPYWPMPAGRTKEERPARTPENRSLLVIGRLARAARRIFDTAGGRLSHRRHPRRTRRNRQQGIRQSVLRDIPS